MCWQGMLQAASQATLPAQYSGQYSGLTPGQVRQPIATRPGSLSKLQRSEFSGTSGEPLSAMPMRTAERRTNANGSDGNRCVAVLAVMFHALQACFSSELMLPVILQLGPYPALLLTGSGILAE